jgi:hypothetical protein
VATSPTVAGKPIKVRGFIDSFAVNLMAGDVLPAEIIDHDMHDVRLGWSSGCCGFDD